jgi:hypothetical protein
MNEMSCKVEPIELFKISYDATVEVSPFQVFFNFAELVDEGEYVHGR